MRSFSLEVRLVSEGRKDGTTQYCLTHEGLERALYANGSSGRALEDL